MKKICYLAGASTIHTVRWVNAMSAHGFEIHLITMHSVRLDEIDQAVRLHKLKIPAPFGYYANVLELRSLLKKIKPDLLHVHYASGYGTLARLTKFTPTLLSVWGSDVYLFPYKSKRNEKILRKNIAAMTRITATGHALKNQTSLFADVNRQIDVIPFGIDLELFNRRVHPKDSGVITIGTVKRLKDIYGIDILLKSVAKLINRLQKEGMKEKADQIRLVIVGEGPQLGELEELADRLGIKHCSDFLGAVPNSEVPKYISTFDIYCAFSRSESFGVAVLEASACEVPVVTSNVGGLPEVVLEGETGYMVESGDIETAAEQLFALVLDGEKRKRLGLKGREFVRGNFDWKRNVSEMIDVYNEIMQSEEKD